MNPLAEDVLTDWYGLILSRCGTRNRLYAGFSLHDELALLVQGGLTSIESLQTATINPAHFLGMEKDLETIEKGKIANLVLLDADPFADIHNTTKISEVFRSGKELDRPALDQLLKSAEAAAKSAVIN